MVKHFPCICSPFSVPLSCPVSPSPPVGHQHEEPSMSAWSRSNLPQVKMEECVNVLYMPKTMCLSCKGPGKSYNSYSECQCFRCTFLRDLNYSLDPQELYWLIKTLIENADWNFPSGRQILSFVSPQSSTGCCTEACDHHMVNSINRLWINETVMT